MIVRMSETDFRQFKKDMNKVYPRSEINPIEYYKVETYPIYRVEIDEELYNYINTH